MLSDVNISISPNPTKGILNINYPLGMRESGNLIVINSTGLIVKQFDSLWSQIDISDLNEGRYHLVIQNINGKKTLPLILMK